MSLAIEPGNLQELCSSLGGSEKLLTELREKLQDWLGLQPHLPQDISVPTLNSFLLGTKLSLEQAKHKLDMFYTLKKLVPELYLGRDPRGPSISRMQKLMTTVCLPKLTPEKHRVFLMRLNPGDNSDLTGYHYMKYIMMIDELLIKEAKYSLGNIYAFDHTSLSLSVLVKFPPTVVKKTEVAMSEAVAKRIAGVHFINAAPLTENLVTLLKKVLKPKLAARVHAHSRGNFEALHRRIPTSILPKDYGGDEPSMDHLAELWTKKIDDNRDWFLEEENIFANDSLRPGPSVNGEDLFGFSGSFRQLEFD